MPHSIDRRAFVGRTLGGVAILPLVGHAWLWSHRSSAPAPGFHGIHAILLTPFDERDAIDEEDLAREVDFCVRAGAHGVVWPQIAGEFYLLSEDERKRGAELVIAAARHRIPVTIGVQATYKDVAVSLAKHAESHGAEAVISLPPYIGQVGADAARDYFESIARAVQLPIFIQNSGSPWGPALSTDLIIELARSNPRLAYIKEEVAPVSHRLDTYVHSGVMKGVFSGFAGRNMLNELARGTSGTMPACEFIDVAVQVYEFATSGKPDEAAELFSHLLPMINLENTYGMAFAKEVLVRRHVFKTARMRNQPGLVMDRVDEEELDRWWKGVAKYLKA